MAEVDTTTKDETEAAAAANADAQTESADAVSTEAEVEGTKTRLEAVEDQKDKKSSGLVIKLAAVLVFLVVVGGAGYLLKDGIVAEPVEEEIDESPSEIDLDPSFSARELIQFGEEALKINDTDEALRFFEGARLRADLESTNDINLTVDIYEGLAQVEELRGGKAVAKIYRDYIRTKQEELGAALPLFNKAQSLFRAGKHVEARKYYARFRLQAASLGENGKRYIESANRRIADSFEIEFKTRYAKTKQTSLTNPEDFFHEK